MTDSPVLLEMLDITKEFPGVKALDGVTMTVRRGDIHAICGENGAGKSTLMKVLSGIYPHGSYTGEIFFDTAPMRFSGIKSSEEQGIVIIHQELALIPELSRHPGRPRSRPRPPRRLRPAAPAVPAAQCRPPSVVAALAAGDIWANPARMPDDQDGTMKTTCR